MTDQEARLILSAFRPEDADDSHFQEALAHARQSPVLGEWLARQSAADAAIAGALDTVSPPPDLCGRILAGQPAPRLSPWWKSAFHPLAALAAALIAICGIYFVYEHRETSDFTSWEHDSLVELTDVVNGQDHLDFLASSPPKLAHWLKASYAPVASPVPPALMQLQSLGCKIFGWHEQTVSIMCFHLTPQELVHLITIDAPLLHREEAPRFALRHGWNTASWTRNGKTYLLATKAAPAELRQILL